jgi:hypothetical protein
LKSFGTCKRAEGAQSGRYWRQSFTLPDQTAWKVEMWRQGRIVSIQIQTFYRYTHHPFGWSSAVSFARVTLQRFSTQRRFLHFFFHFHQTDRPLIATSKAIVAQGLNPFLFNFKIWLERNLAQGLNLFLFNFKIWLEKNLISFNPVQTLSNRTSPGRTTAVAGQQPRKEFHIATRINKRRLITAGTAFIFFSTLCTRNRISHAYHGYQVPALNKEFGSTRRTTENYQTCISTTKCWPGLWVV